MLTFAKGLGRTIGTGAFIAATLLTGAASAEDEIVSLADQGDIAPFCGNEPLRVAAIDGYGGNSWRKTVIAELRDEAAKCPNITRVEYADVAGDIQAYNAAINGFSSQGFEVILAFPDFGDATIPAFRAAYQAGATVVPWWQGLSGEIGVDYAANPTGASYEAGVAMGEFVVEALDGEGTTVFLGGLAGSASTMTWFNGYKDVLSKHPGIKLLDENFIVTNWNPADAQKAVAGLIAKYGEIGAIASDYGVTSLAAVKAYEAARLPVPAQAYPGVSNEYICKYMDAKAAGEDWPMLALGISPGAIRFALRAALAARMGVENPEARKLALIEFGNSLKNKDPLCDPSMPPDADLTSTLSADELKVVFEN
ncbi:substrate-binding domain-containing protein [Sinisalibacter aestuarii]|uniref:ABC transporter substrate-binding protein n=1 Tax=Sinisalibacter aestuarii TaxID=2949426 RepID=A0ABQ5LQU9_9RHOB|nr:substrate-binding domain-containing protein [Sinisalibacter aestuarii]GKY87387.1 ABC transporter substrate-binding protein [Sinisalibacter aestuarii]